jgi:hypothetical protein
VPVRTDPIFSYTIPKPTGGVRRMAILSRHDAIRWHDLAGRVASALQARLGAEVLTNRVHHDRGGWRLAGLGSALRGARLAARRLAAPLLLRTDVEDFYASVTPSVLAASLLRAGSELVDARLAADLVEAWASEGHAGLPIGPPGSAVLANSVLRTGDAALRPLPFLRWVDDYLIGCGTEAEADSALDRLDTALGSLGLTRSHRKTSLVERSSSLPWLGCVISTVP